MNKQVVTIGDKTYTIDLDRAKKLGICIENKVESFNVGDVFRSPCGLVSILIIECNCDIAEDIRYQMAGRRGLETFSDFSEPVTAQEILKHLNGSGYTFVRNINEDIARILEDLNGDGQNNNDDDDGESWSNDEDEESQELKIVELDPELWEAARAKNQALAAVLASENAPGNVMKVVLPKDVVIPFCSIPAGSFTMGSPEDEEGRDPESEKQVEVTLSQPFWLAKTEVTQAQWEAVMGSNPSRRKGRNLPVASVSWNDAQVFLAKLNQNKTLPSGWKFALPTEAQWEYACRAGEKGPYSGGGLEEVAWFPDNSEDKAHEVGLKKPNAWGLHDMLGNVAEWCADEFSLELIGGKDPVGTDPESKWAGHVMRGGSYCNYGFYDNQVNEWRAAMRHFEGDDGIYGNFGIRIAIVPSIALDRPGDLMNVNQRQFSAGDVYESPSGNVRILIIPCDHGGNTFQVAGLNGLEPYSDLDEPASREAILNFLKKGEYVFVKNINDGVAALIAE